MSKSHGVSVSALSNADLIAGTRAMVGRCNVLTAELITHLGEVDARKLYLEQAQPSMFAWCVAELGCSEDVACNWIAVARSSRRYPAVLDALRAGRVHLTGLRMLAPHLADAGHAALLDEAAGKSKREIEELIARIAPRPAVAASIRKLPRPGRPRGSQRTAAPSLDQPQGAGSAAAPTLDPSERAESTAAPKADEPQEAEGAAGLALDPPQEADDAATQATSRSRGRGRAEPLSSEAFKVTFTASRCLRDKILQAQALLGHQVPAGDLAEIFERGLDMLIDDVRKKRFGLGRKPRRPKSKASSEATGKRPPVATQPGKPSDHPVVAEPKSPSDHPVVAQPKSPSDHPVVAEPKSPGDHPVVAEPKSPSDHPAPAGAADLSPAPALEVAGDARPSKTKTSAKTLQGSPKLQPPSGKTKTSAKSPQGWPKLQPPYDKAAIATAAPQSAAKLQQPLGKAEIARRRCRKRPSRYIPAEVRRAVLERDGEQCTFVDERGRRCPERACLELDHVGGFARLGRHTIDGIRVLCRRHNQWAAEKMYGRAFMEERRGAEEGRRRPRADAGSSDQSSKDNERTSPPIDAWPGGPSSMQGVRGTRAGTERNGSAGDGAR